MILAAVLLAAPQVTPAPPSQEVIESSAEWPRAFTSGGHEVLVFQPQIDSWPDYERIEARAALAVTLAGATEPAYGALTLTASSKVDFETRTVLIDDRQVQEVGFPNATPSQARTLTKAVTDALPPGRQLLVSLDLVLANVERTQQETREIEVNLEPPPIFYSDRPALLVMFMDQPRFEAIDGTTLLFATNTNWDVFLDSRTSKYFLRDGKEWMTAPDPLEGPWGPASILPLDITRLPQDDDWAEVRKAVPGKAPDVMPAVFTATRPAELILTDGPPSLSSVPGTRLLYVTNTDSDLFLVTGAGAGAGYYLLTAGRWFRAAALGGPWTSATRDLPEELSKIPESHAKAHVLASVPGTPAAQEAVLQASIPRKVTVDRSTATVRVVYDGDPQFVVIEDTTVSYAVNSPNDVFLTGGKYYCCYQGVWFVASKPQGPWRVCTEVPAAIYTIPSTHPSYSVTYVHVYDSTPSTVVVGYTAGYVGVYESYGVVMFGLGLWLAAEYYDDYHYHAYHCHSNYYGYGGHVHYDHDSGTYYRGGYAYGPYGGAGRGAAYDPATGTYHRGAYVYGPEGSRFAEQAYNPRTGTRAARGGGSDPYGSWSRGVVTRGDDWVRGGRATDGETTVGGFETSRGAKGLGRSGPDGNAGAVKTRKGDVYAGKDGKVYKRENGEWKERSNGGWSSVESYRSQSRPEGRTPEPKRAAPGTGRDAGAASGARSGRTGTSPSRSLERDSRARSRASRSSQRFRSLGGRSFGGRRGGGRRR